MPSISVILSRKNLWRQGIWKSMSEQQADTMGAAIIRLEAALERLDRAVEARRAAAPPGEGDMVPKAAVAALATQLDATIAKLRANLGNEG